ncbi:MAG TPA: helix-turn-helix domain-containing protein [Roseateles sp.]
MRPVTGLLATEFALSFATDGISGLHRTQGQQPDAVLMDTELPGVVDGLVACRLLRADSQTAGIPVLLVSADTSPADRVRGFEAGAVDYICKPLWPEEVLARVKVHLPDLAEAPPALADPEQAVVTAAKSLIDAQLNALPGIEALARQVGVGARRLRDIFRRHTGLTLQAYIAEQRIRTSLRLLEKTSMSVNGVAFEVGFRTPGNFSTAFRARTGMTPLAWRRQRGLGF